MPSRTRSTAKKDSTANIGFEANLWGAAEAWSPSPANSSTERRIPFASDSLGETNPPSSFPLSPNANLP